MNQLFQNVAEILSLIRLIDLPLIPWKHLESDPALEDLEIMRKSAPGGMIDTHYSCYHRVQRAWNVLDSVYYLRRGIDVIGFTRARLKYQ